MNDSDVIRELISVIKPLMIAQGFTDIEVRQAYQGRSNSTPNKRTILIHKLLSTRVSWGERVDAWNRGTEIFDHKERFKRIVKLQIDGLIPPSYDGTVTCSDMVNTSSDLIQSDFAISKLSQKNIGIMFVGEVRETYFTNEEGNFEQNPSFDIELSYESEITYSENPVNSIETVVKGF